MSVRTTSIVFPGQGTQRAGMGREVHVWSPAARATYEEASDALGLDLAALCFSTDERLALTEYAQPAILATSIAILRSVQAECGLRGDLFGGHSLGEYTALVAAGALALADAVRLVRARGRLMQDAVAPGRGRMVAVIADDLDREAIATAIAGIDVALANDNSRAQVVLSGVSDDTRVAERRIEAALGGVRFVELEVSAPFHSPLMAVVEPAFAERLGATLSRLEAARAALVASNFTGELHDPDAERVVERLVRQISGTVRWRRNMEVLAARSARVIEIGPARPLRGFFKTIGVDVEAITDARSAMRLVAREAA